MVRTVFQILLLLGSINTVVKGAGAGCYINDWFAIDCKNQIRVNYPISWICANGTKTAASVDLAPSPFVFSQFANKFLVVGCDNFASLTSPDGTIVGGCMSVCEKSTTLPTVAIPRSLQISTCLTLL
uniref:Wall-associated receptor kinase galacturonan-binding domain-containing protein n=1 Tax=Quercus lobata TaxID=97700 RepID=A0A7N2LJ34_QUELO